MSPLPDTIFRARVCNLKIWFLWRMSGNVKAIVTWSQLRWYGMRMCERVHVPTVSMACDRVKHRDYRLLIVCLKYPNYYFKRH